MQLGVTYSYSPHGVSATAFSVLLLALVLLELASMWSLFRKAGRSGWAAIVPIYNFYVLAKVAQRSGWWIVLLIVPFANLVATVVLLHGLARAFGKGVGFTIGLIVLGFIFLPILGLGSAAYLGEPGSKLRLNQTFK